MLIKQLLIFNDSHLKNKWTYLYEYIKVILCPGYDGKLHPFTKAQFSTIEVLVEMPMTRWEFRIVPCQQEQIPLQHAPRCWSVVMRFTDVQRPAPLNLLRHFAAQYKSLVIIIIHSAIFL